MQGGEGKIKGRETKKRVDGWFQYEKIFNDPLIIIFNTLFFQSKNFLIPFAFLIAKLAKN